MHEVYARSHLLSISSISPSEVSGGNSTTYGNHTVIVCVWNRRTKKRDKVNRMNIADNRRTHTT